MSPLHAFVTGATGFLGHNLVEELLARGWEVTALHRPGSDPGHVGHLPIHLVPGDILDPRSLRRAMPSAVDAVFHVAADTSVWSRHNRRQWRTNVEGTRNVVRTALEARAWRLVHTSTWNVFGLEQGEISEELPERGGQSWINYDRSKFFAEEEVREGIAAGLDAVIVNPAHVMGRYDRRGWARLIIAAHERWLPGVPPGAGTFCHAHEVAKAHVVAAERGRSGQNYLLSGADAEFVELFRVINQVTGSTVPLRPLPAWLLLAAGWANVAVAAVTGHEPEATPEGVAIASARARVVSRRAEQELGLQAQPLWTMVQDSYAWLRAEGLVRDH